LIFLELTDKCTIENKYNNYNSDLYSIAWIWINMVTFALFISLFSTAGYIAYEMSYKEDKYYKYKKDDILKLERERDECELC